MSKNHMKLLFVTYEYGDVINGGVGKLVNQLCAELSPRVQQLDILLIKYSHDTPEVVFILYSAEQQRIFSSSTYLGELTTIIEHEQYRAVHFFCPGGEARDILMSLCNREIRPKLIYSCHSIHLYEKDIRLATPEYLDNEACFIKHSDYLHLLNQTSLVWLREAYPIADLSSDRIKIIANGISLSEELLTGERKKRRDSSVKTLLCISRWCHGKGLEYLLDAMPFIARVYGDVQLVLAGRREQSWENNGGKYLQMIDKKIAQLGTSVRVYGWVDERQKTQLYTDADLCLVPSEIEYFPYSVLEPAMMGVPIVSNKIATVDELLDGEKGCRMCDVKNPESFAQAVIELLADSRAAEQRADYARDRVGLISNWDTVAQQYLDFYLEDSRYKTNANANLYVAEV